MDQTFMKERPIFPLVLTMSLPMVISMLVNALYNIIDSYFVAQISERAMTALSLVFPLQNLINAIGVGIGIGINAVAAYYLGAGDSASANKTISQGTVLNAIHGILLCAICIPVMPFFLQLFTSDTEVISYGLQYTQIVFLFASVQTVGVSFEKIFQAVGKMKVSMFCMLCGCITNIILDPLLIFGFGPIPAMGVRGAALATGIGQLLVLFLYMFIFFRSSLPVQFYFKKSLFGEPYYKKIYSVGIPATLNMALPSLLITALNGILAGFSQVYVLILGVYYKLQTFIYLTANGIVQGIRPLVGYNYGAGRGDRVKKICNTALLLSLSIMAVGFLLCLTIPGSLIGLFSENVATISAGAKALRIISCGFIVSAVSVTISGTFEGLGKGLPSLIISLIRYIAIIPVAFLVSRFVGPTGVWHAFWIIELLAACISWGLFRKFTFY